MKLHVYIYSPLKWPPTKPEPHVHLLPTLCTALTTVHINSKRNAALAHVPLSSKEILTWDTQSCVNTT